MVTTIQLNENVKDALDSLKSNKQTYEEVILSLMEIAEKQRSGEEQLLIEGCNEMYDDMLEESKVWGSTLMDGLNKNEKWNNF